MLGNRNQSYRCFQSRRSVNFSFTLSPFSPALYEVEIPTTCCEKAARRCRTSDRFHAAVNLHLLSRGFRVEHELRRTFIINNYFAARTSELTSSSDAECGIHEKSANFSFKQT